MLEWHDIRAEDGTNDGWETACGRYAISSITHTETGSVEWFLERSPMDDAPPGAADVDVVKALAEAYEDSPTAFAEFEGRRRAAREQAAGERRKAAAVKALRDSGAWDEIVADAVRQIREAG